MHRCTKPLSRLAISSGKRNCFWVSCVRLVSTRTNQQQLISPKIDPSLSNANPSNNITKCIRVALIGQPNVGKSTLANAIVGVKVSAVSPRAHTTRQQIHCVWTTGDTQVIIADTPGLIAHHLARRINSPRSLLVEPQNAIVDADIVLNKDTWESISTPTMFFSSAGKGPLNQLRKKPAILVINKIDRISKKGKLSRFIDHIYTTRDSSSTPGDSCYNHIFPISALDSNTLSDLKTFFVKSAPERNWEYDANEVTSQSFADIVSEVIREQAFLRYRQEIPYILEHTLDHFAIDEAGVLCIESIVSTQRRSQKVHCIAPLTLFLTQTHNPSMSLSSSSVSCVTRTHAAISIQPIVIGKQGQALLEVCRAAEVTLSSRFGLPVSLTIRVVSRDST
eukprot:gene7465-542_t